MIGSVSSMAKTARPKHCGTRFAPSSKRSSQIPSAPCARCDASCATRTRRSTSSNEGFRSFAIDTVEGFIVGRELLYADELVIPGLGRARKRRKRKARRQTFAQLRLAALRRWRPSDTPGKVAARLDQPTEYVHMAIAVDVKRVVAAYGKDTTSKELAADLELPIAFVNYCIRRINAVALERRQEREQKRGEWIARSNDHERGDPMTPHRRDDRRRTKRGNKGGGRLRAGVGARPSI